MTLTQYQTNLHRLYQGDNDVPASSDEDYTIRTTLLEAGIEAWDRGTVDDSKQVEEIEWKELWTTLADAADGSKTTLASTVTYTCPADFRKPGGYVRLIDSAGKSSFYKVVRPEKSELLKNHTYSVCWFTGNKKVGFTLHFLSAPTAGLTIDYPYYKDPFIPSTTAHVIEMSDPWFAVYFALAKLHEYDGEGDRAILALTQAKGRLDAMKTQNAVAPNFQEDYVPDVDFEAGTGGFGV